MGTCTNCGPANLIERLGVDNTENTLISYDLLEDVAKGLALYRQDGRQDILFDSRDRGNYSAYGWDHTAAMLRRHDATGIAVAMLLNEMIEATINGSTLELRKVLREEGFVDRIRSVLALKANLDRVLAGPMNVFMDRITTSLKAVSSELGVPDSREVTICLRDAIYCMDKGLTLRWLQCEESSMSAPVPLAMDIGQYDSIAAFTDALRQQLPFGAHLGRIGLDMTAIGIRQPGRIAYLSSMSINVFDGGMHQQTAHNADIAEAFDLDTPVQRYPAWTKSPGKQTKFRSECSDIERRADAEHSLNRIAVLPRDRLIWLAMVVDMAAQRMAETQPGSVALADVALRALAYDASSVGLPAVIAPNWTLKDPSLDAAFNSLGLTEWESRYLRTSIIGMEVGSFLPIGNMPMALNLASRLLVPCEDDDVGSYDSRFSDRHVAITPAQPDMIGTHAEVEEARFTILRTNLAKYLLQWGNARFEADWEAYEPELIRQLKNNFPRVLSARCVNVKEADYVHGLGLTLYTQSSAHKGYKPRCFINGRKPMTHYADFRPLNGSDFVEMLGLSDESDLPVFLRGWTREQSWTTTDPYSPGSATPAAPVIARWEFSRRQADEGGRRPRVCRVVVVLNQASVPAMYLQPKQPEPSDSAAAWPF